MSHFQMVRSQPMIAHEQSSRTKQTLMSPAQRVGVQLPRARCIGSPQKSCDLAREAVNCNAVFGGSRPTRLRACLNSVDRQSMRLSRR
jgi:hypothetical protein